MVTYKLLQHKLRLKEKIALNELKWNKLREQKQL